MNYFIYSLEERVAIWEGAALILDIDPADAVEIPTNYVENNYVENIYMDEKYELVSECDYREGYGIGEIISGHFEPEKRNFNYQKVMSFLIREVESNEGFNFDAEGLWDDPWAPPEPDDVGEVCESSTIRIDALKQWAVEQGFKSDFLDDMDAGIQPNSDLKASNAALKVIGLFMLYLSKKQHKYKSGGRPNKSQIRSLLLELAEEHNISDYGLSKVDERLLKKALDYLDEQKKQ